MQAGASGEPDYYAILGVSPGAEREVIDAAYRALARKYHPDVNREPDAAQRTRTLNDAYHVLHDPQARAAYDARRLRTPRRRAPTLGADRPIDLFGAALTDVWRRWAAPRPRRPAESIPEGGRAVARSRRRRDWLVPLAALALGALGGAAGAPRLFGRERRALLAYWSVAAPARAAVAEARVRYGALATGGYASTAANSAYGPVANELIADLDAGVARLRAAGAVPAAAEAYHFLQLDDWREERDLRQTQRDAIQSRLQDLWAATLEREAAWRGSPLHERTEAAASQLAALLSR
jgi:hypothetical protein